ncbi:MAG: phosphate ABC transporter substrate-binding/OmpA family protein [Bacteroidota bacterium]
MARRLTTFSKLLITMLIVGIIVIGGKYILDNTDVGQDIQKEADRVESTSSNDRPTSSGSGNMDGLSSRDIIKIGVVTWGGYAGGQYFNEGFEPTKQSRFYKDYGFSLEFKVLDDFVPSREAWKQNDVDLLWATIDAFPTEAGALSQFDPVVVFQADWSRGGDAVVARRGISNVSDLRGKKVAVAELTPSHSFLLWLLEAAGMTQEDIEIIPQESAVQAAQIFKTGRVDAAVVWSPDDILAVKAVPGSRVLESTRSASNIIADVFFAKRSFVNDNRERLQQLYEGWMKGAAEINSSASARQKAATILGREFTERGTALTTEEADEMIGNVRLVTHGDNKNFFGLNNNYKGVTGENLYSRMANVYYDLGHTGDKMPPTWNSLNFPSLVMNTTLTGEEHFPERAKEFASVTKADETKAAIATKRVSINFRTGEFRLDENSKYIIDREFVPIANAFSNSRIRIEGNTDTDGSRSTNVALSKKRAQAVANYLINEYNMPRNRFVVVGNGPDKPVASNNTADGKAKNRRTDFELISE